MIKQDGCSMEQQKTETETEKTLDRVTIGGRLDSERQ